MCRREDPALHPQKGHPRVALIVSSVSNGPFLGRKSESGQSVDGKRTKLGQSALLMKTYFNQSGLDKWEEGAMAARAQALFGAAALLGARPSSPAGTPDAVLRKLSGSDAKK